MIKSISINLTVIAIGAIVACYVDSLNLGLCSTEAAGLAGMIAMALRIYVSELAERKK